LDPKIDPGQALDEQALNVYVDGSAASKPRRGGIGIRFVFTNDEFQVVAEDVRLPGYKSATIGQMELLACTTALKQAVNHPVFAMKTRLVLYTDSLYVQENYQRAIFQWPKQGWRNREGRPILNADLWVDFVKSRKRIRKYFEIRWVKGHAKDPHNRAADRLAKTSARLPLNKPLSVVGVRRKLTAQSVELGSVQMLGQRISIRIITREYLPIQKVSKYKYEVISRASKLRGRVDIAFTAYSLKPGHSYSVRFNRNNRNPSIAKVFREIG
jgi:ribonuclease HI